MLKNVDKYDNTSHFSYREYEKPRKAPNKDIVVFTSVFFAGLLILLGFAKMLSPNVDVGVSADEEMMASVNDAYSDAPTYSIDDRLRRLKSEDEGKISEPEDIFSPELDEKVVLPMLKKRSVGQIEAEKNEKSMEDKQPVAKPEKESQSFAKADNPKQEVQSANPMQDSPVMPVVSARVVVGYYATEKQAEVAKSIINDTGLGVVPVVKHMSGYYTLQVGSYPTKEKAQQAANNLLKNNLPARVVVE